MQKLFIVTALLLWSLASVAQTDSTDTYEEPNSSAFWEKVTLGGNFGLQFGTGHFRGYLTYFWLSLHR